MSYRIGVDISGGDFAPKEIFKGALLAKKELQDQIILIGVKEEIEQQLKIFNLNKNAFEIIEAPEKISMGEPPAIAVRKKKNSSIVIGSKLLKEKKIDAFVSCGNTGACVCAATLNVGLIEGVERPGIALKIPTKIGVSLLIDVGANIDPKPIHLFQYGIMASVYYRVVLNKKNPTVGLLNIGEEETKGPDYARSVHKLFSTSSIDFVGNVEPKDIFSGVCDCIVCDGYAGNVALKVAEGVAETMGKFLLKEIKKDWLGKLGLLLILNSIKRFKRIIDYSEYGGAPLLGVDGIVIIGHGRSNAQAVKNAIKVASKEVAHNLNAEIKKSIDVICQNKKIQELLVSQAF
ncbi:MAG: phosphate acyltransferase PlsX [Candidatus Omnitrophica bacterium]|nr:phosphate acyltransferase PlsX [Candidatus Omnitrophota bacterium]